ncbi:MAG: aminotransferase class I/II-fold pyridoxal phosphate-dependent enzyme [Burkholderiales bacterium]|nr:aminotransferase class I/II-fold pyridoxal phosphate-dependent enzyme [Burkholderiales bacterium]
MTLRPPSKLPQVGTTIFTVMSALATEHGAVNLGQGFPDFDPDPRLQALVAQAMRAGHNQYAPLAGVPALLEALAEKIERCYGRACDPGREITVTAGATEALMSAVLAVVHPGDEVIVLEPAFDSYVPAIRLAGGRPVLVPLAPGDYAVPWKAVRAAINRRTRLLMLNFPHNPSGAVLGPADLDALESVVRGTDVLLLSDEVSEHMVYDGRRFESLARRPALAERAFVISSFAKTLHATGWKIGYVLAPRELTEEFRRVHQFVVFAVFTPGQHAIAAYLRDPAAYETLAAFYQAKRDRFRAGLAGTRFRLLPCPGTFYQLADYAAISEEPEEAFARRLTTDYGVAAIPVSVLYERPIERRVVRFCFAKQEQTLDRAIERLGRV